jgi:3-deoxy-D-manno-octulosonic-acid transferase
MRAGFRILTCGYTSVSKPGRLVKRLSIRESISMNPASPGWRYRLLSIPLYLVWILHALKHGFKHSCPGYLSMRIFGIKADPVPRIWVHASSVGEVRAITPLVHALISQGEQILFTSFTATGFNAIRHSFADSLRSAVIPFDHYWHCRVFFRRHNIKLGLVMETELWPELLYQARKRDIRLILVNARLSPKSLNTGKFVRRLLSTTLGYFSGVLTRNSKDRDALLSMNASADRIKIIGNLKSQGKATHVNSRLIERDYLILASSHAGEEQQFLEARPAELDHYLLVLAPRHPDRSASIQAQIERLGINYSVRSKAQSIDNDTGVYLADTLGELNALMAYARVVVMGGSFDTTGGHNLIEPASLGCAIITGPSDSNITEDIAMLGRDQGVIQVEDMKGCWSELIELLEHPERARALGREAQSRLTQQPDIVQQYMSAINEWLQ